MTAHRVLQDIGKSTELSVLDPGSAGTIKVDRALGICPVVTAGAETRKIASPERAGIILSLSMKTDGGDATITGSGSETFNSGGTESTTITMDTAGDHISLMSIDKGANVVWAVLANNGCSLS